MGEKDAADVVDRQTPHRDVAIGLRPRVDDVDFAAGDDGDAGLGAMGVRHRRGRAANDGAQGIVLEQGVAITEIGAHDALEQGILNGGHTKHGERRRSNKRDNQHEADQTPPQPAMHRIPPKPEIVRLRRTGAWSRAMRHLDDQTARSRVA